MDSATQNDTQQQAQALNPTVDFIAGTIGGVAGLVVGFPFDTVKVRLQTASTSTRTSPSPSTLHLMLSIAREDKRLGIWGLFRGISSPIATAAPLNGLVFASYRFLLDFQRPSGEVQTEAEWTPTLGQIALAGMGCGIVGSVITTPTELIKIRQQMPSSSSFFNSSPSTLPTARQVATDIYKRHGIRGLYRGITATALRDLGFGSYFFAYEATCRYLPPLWGSLGSGVTERRRSETGALVHEMDHREGSESAGLGTLLVAGGVAGIAGWIFTFPMDVVKTRVQSHDGGYYLSSASTAVGTPAPTAISSSGSYGHSHYPHPQYQHQHSYPFAFSRGLHQGQSPSAPKRTLNPYRTTLSTFLHSFRTEGHAVFWRGLGATLLRAVPVNMATFGVFEGVVWVVG
ncbi:hypothetical protein PM082_021935 [Marasmius tenuissimus]|nr:hypothetical protein PM082_021935 [Marasmius tenuissimus]